MNRSTLIVLKTLVWIGCLMPLGIAVYEAVTNTLGPDPTAELASITGLTALWLLAGGLAISPARALSPRLSWLIKFRLLPLAVTSTTWSIRKLGGKNWNRLHMLVYLAAITAMVHYWWKVKTGVLEPAPYALVILVLLGVRPLLAWNQRRKARTAVSARAD